MRILFHIVPIDVAVSVSVEVVRTEARSGFNTAGAPGSARSYLELLLLISPTYVYALAITVTYVCTYVIFATYVCTYVKFR